MTNTRRLEPADFLPKPFTYPPDEPTNLPTSPIAMMARQHFLDHKYMPRLLAREASRIEYAAAWNEESQVREQVVQALLAQQARERGHG